MRSLVLMLILALAAFAGCLSERPSDDVATPEPGALVPVQERHGLPFVTDGAWSQTLEEGLHAILDPLSVFVDVELPLDHLGAAADPLDPPRIHMGLWLPDVPEGTKVPVIADVGPYYGGLDTPATEAADRLGRFLIENFVPYGYGVAQVSVFGSGLSNHCMDLMGMAEQLGIDAAVTWLGSQEWSNGNVGLIGRSYDGSTPWQAATVGNPHLATIVPIGGITGMHELMWRNGSAEFRAPLMHNVVYGFYGIDAVDVTVLPTSVTPGEPNAMDRQTACTDYLTGPVQGLGAYVTGDHFLPEVNSYWAERHFLDRVLENYGGSVYFIHGMQDWNVDPHLAFPAYQRLLDAGIEAKGLFGQWGHHYPDRASEHGGLPEGRGQEAYPATVRHDWAQDLLEWFDHYLMGSGAKPQLHVEVQDNQGAWRIEATYPPRDAAWHELSLGEAQGADAPGGLSPVGGASFLGMGPRAQVLLGFPALDDHNDTRIAGLAQLHATVTPTGPGGQLFVQLRDSETGLRLGHAIMDLRFHAGGHEMQPVVPGQPIVARMEFQALDVVLPAGHGIDLRIAPNGEDYLPSVISSPVLVNMDDSVLRLPVVERGPETFFLPPGQD